MKHPALFKTRTRQKIEISTFKRTMRSSIYYFKNAHAQQLDFHFATLQFPPQKIREVF